MGLKYKLIIIILGGARHHLISDAHAELTQEEEEEGRRRRRAPITGRQLPPLYSVVYGIISMRHCLLPCNFSLEKIRCLELALIAISLASLPGGSMKFIWWKLKMSYHTAYPSWDCPAVVFHLFLYSFICEPTTAFTSFSKLCKSQLSSVFFLSWDSPGAGFHF